MGLLRRNKPKTFQTQVAAFTHRVGKPLVVQSESPRGRYVLVFEDDGDTGSLYGLDQERLEMPIVDALHIYDVQAVADQAADYPMEIRWAADRERGGLFIEGLCHAVFDFNDKRASCRDDFPPADGGFTDSHAWDESLAVGL